MVLPLAQPRPPQRASDQASDAGVDMIDAIIIGLGNPGKEYAGTRHNVGEDTVALLAKRYGVALKAGRDKALVAEATVVGGKWWPTADGK